MSKAREALNELYRGSLAYVQNSYMNHQKASSEFKVSKDILQPLVDRDEPKPVLHENVMKQFGKCPVCNSSVAIQFHSDFCGKCGCRLKWRGEEK